MGVLQESRVIMLLIIFSLKFQDVIKRIPNVIRNMGFV